MLTKKVTWTALTAVLLALATWVYLSQPASMSAQIEQNTPQHGLVEVPCWFERQADWPEVLCYRMHVPENHQQGDRLISFPVIYFKHFAGPKSQPPLLHLGAGGPGGAMWLDYPSMIALTLKDFELSVLRQGRDLILMDPRGTGMAQPRLSCSTAVSYSLQQLSQQSPLAQRSLEDEQLLRECIVSLQQQGIEVASYNSLSVVNDLKLLQQALQLDTWSLFGVSYGAVYALLFTNAAAERVDTLILDSPAFPAIKNVDDPAARFLATFKQLENYCQFASNCDEPLTDFAARFWQLISTLDEQPLFVAVPSGFFWVDLPVQVSGELLLSILAWAAYDDAIYRQLPAIVTALEQRDISSFYPYVDSYVAYLKDQRFSVVSMASHLCFDEVPFIDYAKIKQSVAQIPKSFLRDSALYSYQWPASLCDVFGSLDSPQDMIKQTQTAIPTLFLQGELDTVTPLADVKQQLPFFSRSQLRLYPLSHAVHGRLDCVDADVAAFLKAPLEIAQPAVCQLNAAD